MATGRRRSAMNTEALQLSISIAGLLIGVIGLPLIYMQLRGLQ